MFFRQLRRLRASFFQFPVESCSFCTSVLLKFHLERRSKNHFFFQSVKSALPTRFIIITMASSRKRTKITLNVSEAEFKRLGCDIINRSTGGSRVLFLRRWNSAFGVDPIVVVDCWTRLEIDTADDPEMNGAQPSHLLWALLFLKKCTALEDLSKDAGCDEKTFDKWAKIFIRRISYLVEEVVRSLLHDPIVLPASLYLTLLSVSVSLALFPY